MSMKTLMGHSVDYHIGRVAHVAIGEIAHSLAIQARYLGHTPLPYSVAQHSVLVSRKVPEHHALWGLLHDAAEAYIGDMPRPLKKLFPEFKALENKFLEQIADNYGLEWPMPPCIKEVDNRILATEMRCPAIYNQNVIPFGAEHAKPYANTEIIPIPWDTALCEFLERFRELIGEK